MAHIHEKIDFTASAYIVNEGKVLLRMHDKYKMWLGIGGHIELYEDPIEALQREVKEESGLNINILSNEQEQYSDGSTDLPLPMFINRHQTSLGHEHIDLVYAAAALSTEIKPSEEEVSEGVEFRWFTAEELTDSQFSVGPHVQKHAKQAINLSIKQ